MSPHSTRPALALVLASTSRYRRALLERLRIPFVTCGSEVDESRGADEDALTLAQRLSREKAAAVASRYPGSLIIGSDQVAVRGRIVLGKPGTRERCIEQLRDASGQRVVFHTGVQVLDTRTGRQESHVDTTTVTFRTLTDAEIRRYVDAEQSFDCAGGFKCEGLGIALFDRIDSQDPTALMGLPLIWVSGALRRSGLELP
jgi:septum formation protein